MNKERMESMLSDVKIYSDGLLTSLVQKKFTESDEYIGRIRNTLGTISEYIESHRAEEKKPESGEPLDVARTEADRAAQAARIAEGRVVSLEASVKEKSEEVKRLKRTLGQARKEAKKARVASKKAIMAERKAAKQAVKATEAADKAREAAR